MHTDLFKPEILRLFLRLQIPCKQPWLIENTFLFPL